MFRFLFLFLGAISLSSGLQINCNYNFWTWLPLGGRYGCRVTQVVLTGSVNLTTVAGTHLPGMGLSTVELVDFSFFNQLNFVPQEIHGFFPNFIGLRLERLTISSLQGDELDQYRNLQYFSAHGNFLTSVPGNLFTNTPYMAYVSFNLNHITSVGSDLLHRLPSLRTVDFRNNFCINRLARGEEEVGELIEALRVVCPESNVGTTTTTLQPPVDPNCPAGNEVERICDLETKVVELDDRNVALAEYIRDLTYENLELREIIDWLINWNQVQDDRLRTSEQRLDILEERILGLSSNPCACKN